MAAAGAWAGLVIRIGRGGLASVGTACWIFREPEGWAPTPGSSSKTLMTLSGLRFFRPDFDAFRLPDRFLSDLRIAFLPGVDAFLLDFPSAFFVFFATLASPAWRCKILSLIPHS